MKNTRIRPGSQESYARGCFHALFRRGSADGISCAFGYSKRNLVYKKSPIAKVPHVARELVPIFLWIHLEGLMALTEARSVFNSA